MGGVPVKHRSKSAVGHTRSHLALKKIKLVVCANCKAPNLPHRACSNCKQYKKAV
ncbi:MAG: 50S ribosomal protein L32 [Candidatus Harrisonbacteria bacterium]|nr:50S ribosomal protein L32 [Candidatus Harrisonbacteria bacterium]